MSDLYHNVLRRIFKEASENDELLHLLSHIILDEQLKEKQRIDEILAGVLAHDQADMLDIELQTVDLP